VTTLSVIASSGPFCVGRRIEWAVLCGDGDESTGKALVVRFNAHKMARSIPRLAQNGPLDVRASITAKVRMRSA
jgi:hypothetical protein